MTRAGAAWRSAAGMKHVATALLALALAGIAVTYAANQRSVALQGPGTLRAATAETLWLVVNDELWTLDRSGRRTGVHAAQQLGLTEAASNIVPAPAGQVLLTSRGDLQWQVVDGATLARVRSITPQWPADFADNDLRAIHLAVAPDGDIAVATGGGHTVLLFDAQGRYKARTAPGTYRFTNGIFWSPEGWWTTDTNRFALHLLDARTLAVKQTVPLQAAPPAYPFLGEALPSQGRPLPGTQQAPLATLTRLGHLMEPGHAVDVFADGTQAVFNAQAIGQLRDIAWFDGHLLAVDGDNFSVLRFGADRAAAQPFGDAQVRGALARMQSDRLFWRNLGSHYALFASAALLLAGLAAYARHRRLAALEVVAARQGGQAAAAALPLRRLARQRWWIYGVPIAARVLVIVVAGFAVFPLLHHALLGPQPADLGRSLRLLVSTLMVPLVVVAWWQQRRHQRLAARPEYEAALNHRAIDWLRLHDDFDRIKLEAEVPRETVYLPGWRPRWLLVTNRRVLLFVASARERSLASEWPRRSVVYAGAPDGAPGGYRRAPWLRLLLPTPNLALAFTTGTVLHLHCASSVTAARVAGLLMSSPAIPDDDLAVAARPRRLRRRWHEVLASFVVPGSGQWLQGRFASGLALFTLATLLAIFDWWPVAWALHGPKMEVSALSVVSALASWAIVVLFAASDAWHFSAARRAR